MGALYEHMWAYQYDENYIYDCLVEIQYIEDDDLNMQRIVPESATEKNASFLSFKHKKESHKGLSIIFRMHSCHDPCPFSIDKQGGN